VSIEVNPALQFMQLNRIGGEKKYLFRNDTTFVDTFLQYFRLKGDGRKKVNTFDKTPKWSLRSIFPIEHKLYDNH
jgi:hypothetical protein